MDVVGLSNIKTPEPDGESIAARVKAKVEGPQKAKINPDQQKQRDQAEQRLGHQCRAFDQLMRKRLRTPDNEAPPG